MNRGVAGASRVVGLESGSKVELSRGVYWLFAAGGCALLLSPLPVVQFAVAGLLWLVFLGCYAGAPERTILLYIVLAPATALLPAFRLLPGLNFDTLIILALAGACWLVRTEKDRIEPRNTFVAPVLFFVFLLTFSAVYSSVLGTAYTYDSDLGLVRQGVFDIFKRLKSVVLFAFLGPIAFRLIRRPEILRTAVWLIGGATVFVTLHSILQFRAEAALGSFSTT